MGLIEQRSDAGKGAGGEAHAAGVAVVDEHRRTARLLVPGVGDAAEIAPVTEHHQRHQADQGVFHGVDAAHEVQPGRLGLFAHAVRHLHPQPLGLEHLRRQVEGNPGEHPQAAGGTRW